MLPVFNIFLSLSDTRRRRIGFDSVSVTPDLVHRDHLPRSKTLKDWLRPRRHKNRRTKTSLQRPQQRPSSWISDAETVGGDVWDGKLFRERRSSLILSKAPDFDSRGSLSSWYPLCDNLTKRTQSLYLLCPEIFRNAE